MIKHHTRAIFWDIDGTLLVTGRAGMIAWERAFADGHEGRAFPAVRPDGLTDHQIAGWLLGQTDMKRPASDAEQGAAAALVQRYEAALAGALPLRQGRVLEQVAELLAWLGSERPEVLSWLVTGNTRAGGSAKLRHYGLERFFVAADAPAGVPTLAGSFSNRVEPRAEIVRRALQMAQLCLPALQPSEVLVVGDTPHDIDGAHAIGIPVLAVATNTHSIDELKAHHPWRALPALPAPAGFAALLDAET